MLRSLLNHVSIVVHNPRSHYCIVACIAVLFLHDGAKMADWLFVVLAIACEQNGSA